MQISKNLNREIEQFYRQIAINCAPTILGDKPASLYCIKDKKDLISQFKDHQNEIEAIFGVKAMVLRQSDNHLVILLYNVNRLTDVVNHFEIKQFLRSEGYREYNTLTNLLAQLKARFKECCPHEIGIFLGYPLSDVEAFIKPKSECLLCGYWKVFSDVQSAQETFKRYDRAKQCVISAFSMGIGPYELFDRIKSNDFYQVEC